MSIFFNVECAKKRSNGYPATKKASLPRPCPRANAPSKNPKIEPTEPLCRWNQKLQKPVDGHPVKQQHVLQH